MGGGSVDGRTKFDALLVVQERLREMPKETRELKWQPVDGWHAIRKRILMHTKSDHRRKKHYETSYRVLACPQYEVG